MSIKTIRFNKEEESMLGILLSHYHKDFSACVKDLLHEKIEDLRDIGFVKHLKVGKLGDYVSAADIDKLT